MNLSRATKNVLMAATLVLSLGSIGCLEVTQQICNSSNQVDVDRLAGKHIVTILDSDFNTKQQTFELERKNQGEYAVVNGPGVMKTCLLGNVLGTAVLPVSQLNICLVEGSIFLEKLDEKNGYSVLRLETSNEGLHYSSMHFDPKTLIDKKLNFITPGQIEIQIAEDPSHISWSAMGVANIVLDNSNLSPQEVLTAASFSSIGFMFNRIPQLKESTVRKKMNLSEFKRLRTR